jgi:Flp pilus assembly protein TadG
MVELALSLLVLLGLLLGILDLGRAIYMYNGVEQAEREIARVASVHSTPWPTSSAGSGSP